MASSSSSPIIRQSHTPIIERVGLEAAIGNLSERVDPLFQPLNRMNARKIEGLDLSFPEYLLTPEAGRSLKSYREGELRPSSLLFSELNRLLNLLNQIEPDDDLNAIKAAYKSYIQAVCINRGKSRWQLIKGEARLIGRLYGEATCLLVARKRAREIASLDAYNQLNRTILYGASAVFRAGDAFFKREHQNPLKPGVEQESHELAALLVGGESPPFVLLKIENIFVQDPNNESLRGQQIRLDLIAEGGDPQAARYFREHPDRKAVYPFHESRLIHIFQTSKAVPGTLLTNLLDPRNPDNILDHLTERISHSSFSKGFFLDLACTPKDARADNFQTTPDGEIRTIDYDDGFERTVSRGYINCRTIRFLLDPLMSLPVEPRYRAHLLALNPDRLLIDWVSAIVRYNESNRDLQEQHLFSSGELRALSLPATLSPTTLNYIHSTLSGSQELLRGERGESITHWELLDRFQPALHSGYRALVQAHPGRPLDAQHRLFGPGGRLLHFGELNLPIPEEEPAPLPEVDPFQALESWLATFFELIPAERQEAILEQLLLSFPNLTKLKLSGLKISDERLLRLADRALHLEELTLISSQSITKDGLIALLNSHPRLALTISDQHRINGAELAELIEFSWDPRHPRTLSFLLGEAKSPLLEARRDQLLRESLVNRSPSLLLGEALLIRGATVTPELLKGVVELGSEGGLRLIVPRYEAFREVRIQGESLLHHAARANRGDQIELLRELGFEEIDLRCGRLEETPLHVASRHGKVDAARSLLRCRANPMLVDGDGKTVLHLSIHPVSTLELLTLFLGLDRETPPIRSDSTVPTHLTQWQLNFLNVREAITPRQRSTPPLLTPWQKQFLGKRGDEVLFSSLTQGEQERLRGEAEKLWEESLELLYCPPFPLELWQRELLLMGDSDGKIPLHFAALQHNPHFAYLLLRAGTPPNTTNSHGYTALHWAAMNNLAETTELLLIGGARTAILNRNQETPFNLALRFRSHQVPRLLTSPELIALTTSPPNDSESDDDLPPISSSSSSSSGPVQVVRRSTERGDGMERILALEDQSQAEAKRGDHYIASTTLAPAFRLAEELSVPREYLTLLELQLDWIASSFLFTTFGIKTPSSHTSQIGTHREALKSIRFEAEQKATIREQQATLIQGYREILTSLFKESFLLALNPIDKVGGGDEERQKGLLDYSFDELNQLSPSRYALLALDQLSRREGFPITEIRFALVVENPNAVPFFENIAQLLEIKISNLGESGRGFGLQRGGERSIVGTPGQVAESLGTSLHTTLLAGYESSAKKERDCSSKVMGWDKWFGFGEIEGETKATGRLSLSLDRWRELQGEDSVEIGLYRPFEAALRYLQLYFKKSFLSPREAIQALPFRSATKTALLQAFDRASSLVMRSQFAQLRREEFQPDPAEVAAIRATIASLYGMVEAFIARPGKEALQRIVN